MNPEVLLELAKRWEADAKPPDTMEASEEGNCDHAKQEGKAQGEREAKRECADTLRTLVSMLG